MSVEDELKVAPGAKVTAAMMVNAQSYNTARFDFMKPRGEHWPITESSMAIPPALVITDSEGALWTLGFDQGAWRTGEFEYDVVRNGKKTGEHACRIEYRSVNGGPRRIRIYGEEGWRVWNGRTFI
jgi:hypothetical protein